MRVDGDPDLTEEHGLIRFVVGPDGGIVPDFAEKLPGRGIYVTASKEALGQAVDKNLFARSAKQPVTIQDGLIEVVEAGVLKRVTDLISLARKAGKAVAGYEKVKGWLADGRAKVLLQASDGSARGKGKLWTPEGGRFFGSLTGSELGLAFGRESVIHGALGAGGLTPRVIEEATRLAGFRGNDGGSDAGKDKTTK
ncbi:MAG: RNA-binding protein [Marinosulfonomonas sp.]|nr:RNA-binding protein [Marinosulfonomonas sp.]